MSDPKTEKGKKKCHPWHSNWLMKVIHWTNEGIFFDIITS